MCCFALDAPRSSPTSVRLHGDTSNTSTAVSGIAKDAKYHDVFGRPVNTKFPCHERSQCCGSGKYPLRNAKFVYEMCTITSETSDPSSSSSRREPLLPTTTHERLLPSTILNRSENARYEGIPSRMTARGRMHMLHEMLAFATCLTCFLHVPVAMASTHGNPVARITPPSCMTRSRHASFLHRYLHELPEPICCRGIIFGFVAVAPLSSTTVTNAS